MPIVSCGIQKYFVDPLASKLWLNV